MRKKKATTLAFGVIVIFVISVSTFIFFQPTYAKSAPQEITCPLEGVKERGLVPCGRSCDDPKTPINEQEQCGFCHFFYLFDGVLNFFMGRLVPAAALLLIVYAGFVFVTARGSPAQLTTAKNILIWTLAGYAVVFVSWMVLNSFLSAAGVVKWTGLGKWWEFHCETKAPPPKKEPQPPVVALPVVEAPVEVSSVIPAPVPLAWPEPAGGQWTKFDQGPWASRINHGAVVFEDPLDDNRQKIWIIGGRSGDEVTSEVWAFDGVRWEKKPSLPAPREEHTVQVFDRKIWLIGGREGGVPKKDVWTFDGTSWQEEAPLPSGRYGHAAVIFQNKIWVIGGRERAFGREDRVFALESGKWVEKDKFPVRIEDHIAINFQDKIWVIGGGKKIGNAKGVWVFDGSKWTAATSKVPGEGISGSHAAVIFNDGNGEKIWVLGGYSAGRAQGNVWTFDGITWQSTASVPAGAPSAELGAMVFKDPRDDKQKVWIIGGFDSAGAYANGAWMYTPQTASGVSAQDKKFVFVTSSQYGADLALPELELAGAEGADARCQERAEAAGLRGKYRAWLSAGNRSPSSRTSFMQYNLPYILPDGTKIAENWQGIVDGYLLAPINRTEKKETVSNRYVWTATNVYGKLEEGNQHCENWSTDESSVYINAKLGNTNFKDPRWTEAGSNVRCESQRSLYCFEQ